MSLPGKKYHIQNLWNRRELSMPLVLKSSRMNTLKQINEKNLEYMFSNMNIWYSKNVKFCVNFLVASHWLPHIIIVNIKTQLMLIILNDSLFSNVNISINISLGYKLGWNEIKSFVSPSGFKGFDLVTNQVHIPMNFWTCCLYLN